jgi:rhodanese-related sulfurtransferase
VLCREVDIVPFSVYLRKRYIWGNDYILLIMNINLTKCLLIILISSILGILYNFINPKGIPLISKQKEIKWASDSLVSSLIRPVDTLNNNMKARPLSEEKSLLNKKATIINPSSISDTIGHKLSKPQTKSNADEEEGFAEPIGINLEQAYKLYTMGIIFIDARDEYEYKTGHIKNSINLPMYYFDKYKDVLSGTSKSQTIICYCGGSDCDLSTQLANKLFLLGYRNNYIFIGGWEQWKTAGYPVE